MVVPSTVISCVYFGIILSVSRFGANMGNEEDELPENEAAVSAPPALTEEEITNWVPDAPLEAAKDSEDQEKN